MTGMRPRHRKRASWSVMEHLAGRKTATGVGVPMAEGSVPSEAACRLVLSPTWQRMQCVSPGPAGWWIVTGVGVQMMAGAPSVL